jgi:hypothetical protein
MAGIMPVNDSDAAAVDDAHTGCKTLAAQRIQHYLWRLHGATAAKPPISNVAALLVTVRVILCVSSRPPYWYGTNTKMKQEPCYQRTLELYSTRSRRD